MTKETNQGAEPIADETLDQAAGGRGSVGGGKVGTSDIAGHPSQWGVQVYKKGSFDFTE